VASTAGAGAGAGAGAAAAAAAGPLLPPTLHVAMSLRLAASLMVFSTFFVSNWMSAAHTAVHTPTMHNPTGSQHEGLNPYPTS
jgi:hypothetical protein